MAAHRGRDAEVEHLRAGRGEHDVRGLDVAVHDPLRVRRGEGRGHLGADPDGDAPVEQPGVEVRAQGLPLDQLHDDVRHLAIRCRRGAEVVHAGDVRVREPRGGPGLGADQVDPADPAEGALDRSAP
nr:hypothetical protein GCM10020092_047000 [Actinoplanes digitatis]